MADRHSPNASHNWLKNLISIIMCVLFFTPFYIILSLSLKTKMDRSSHWLFPKHWNISNYALAWTKGKIGLAVGNTLIITVFAVIIILVVGSIASYPLARRKSRLNKWILTTFVCVMMVPPLSSLLVFGWFWAACSWACSAWRVIFSSSDPGMSSTPPEAETSDSLKAWATDWAIDWASDCLAMAKA